MRPAPRHLLALTLLALTALIAACFDPDISQEIGCHDDTCPGAYECVQGVCVPPGSARHDAAARPPDGASTGSDAAAGEDAPRPQDVGGISDAAAGGIECDPRVQDCFDPNNPRCTLVITQQGPPHDAILACTLDRGTRFENEPCAYTTGSRGLEDDCVLGLICSFSGRCRTPCVNSLDCAPTHRCEPFEDVRQDLGGLGLCQPCNEDEDDAAPCLDP
jgi:hypothetical protein